MEELYHNREVYFLYDINCTFRKWLENHYPGLYSNISKFGIPIFHSYGHKLECQLQYNPRRIEGLGLTDGEDCERLWASLSSLVPMVRQMRDCVFQDMISISVKHIRQSKNRNLGYSLVQKYRACLKIVETSNVQLRSFQEHDPDIREKWQRMELSFLKVNEGDARRCAACEIFTVASSYVTEHEFLYSAHHGTKVSSRLGSKKTKIGIF